MVRTSYVAVSVGFAHFGTTSSYRRLIVHGRSRQVLTADVVVVTRMFHFSKHAESFLANMHATLLAAKYVALIRNDRRCPRAVVIHALDIHRTHAWMIVERRQHSLRHVLLLAEPALVLRIS